ncbi:uncharacterized protein LOC117613183 [Prunus dulcis]|uniref:uncharacterized protein LOC117613183 n=1 Tax=Prunus dulcis TaxID=3755 RepID=UPI0014832CB0|nr:uncharacterized protein LOC117613183 [Prunus dulcis]
MTLLGATQDWFHTLPVGLISSFKELTYVFTKEYTSYRTIKKNLDHLANLQKKYDESLQDYIKRLKAERANISGCDDRIASSAFKRGLPIKCGLYRELTISPCQTLVEVLVTAECHAILDDDRTAAEKAAKQADQPVEQASQRNDMIKDKDVGKRGLQPQRGALFADSYTKFTIPIHQILAHVKNMPWLKKPSPLKENPAKKDTGRYCEFHEWHSHYTNDYFAWKKHLEELVGDGHCKEFIAKRAIQQIKDRDAAANKPPRKKSYRSTNLANPSRLEEAELTIKEQKRKIMQATSACLLSCHLLPSHGRRSRHHLLREGSSKTKECPSPPKVLSRNSSPIRSTPSRLPGLPHLH